MLIAMGLGASCFLLEALVGDQEERDDDADMAADQAGEACGVRGR